ncbi:hypothetical protein [Nocardioides sp. SYSU D00038]|uniref:hypothetical protein n=1 Tax=Nocardioides sp. SYSU D00038 TaxID=2812554 RepID=UPI0019680660|nr:hypothetical protein [Nocardioides sp. SYSU D00038]
MSTSNPSGPAAGRTAPLTLRVAAVLAGLQGAVLCGYSVLEIAHVDADRVGVGVTTALFFLAVGGGLLVAATGLYRCHSWARSPVVVAQLISLLLAWSFRGGDTTAVAAALAVAGVVVLGLLLAPASTAALAEE